MVVMTVIIFHSTSVLAFDASVCNVKGAIKRALILKKREKETS